MVVAGRGVAEVYATGIKTEMGKIGKSLASIKIEETLLHKETGKIVQVVTGIALALFLMVFLIYTIGRGEIIQGLLSGLTLAMAILPEEFPVVLVIFLTVGAWRISKRKVLTRHSATIETLGAATVLCTDKTGTLTMNKMELATLYTQDSFCELAEGQINLPDKFQALVETGILASEKDPFDPIERELRKRGESSFKQIRDWSLIKEYPCPRNCWQLRMCGRRGRRAATPRQRRGRPRRS
jgi:Ca2+-transporting ATPase